jgi:hypothetical protein
MSANQTQQRAPVSATKMAAPPVPQPPAPQAQAPPEPDAGAEAENGAAEEQAPVEHPAADNALAAPAEDPNNPDPVGKWAVILARGAAWRSLFGARMGATRRALTTTRCSQAMVLRKSGR